jgi:hypothetical protein
MQYIIVDKDVITQHQYFVLQMHEKAADWNKKGHRSAQFNLVGMAERMYL